MATGYAFVMHLVIRSNYGDESIALMQMLREQQAKEASIKKTYVVYIETGWAAEGWQERVAKGELFARACGFEAVQLKPKVSFAELVKERKSFPSPKFQWCAGFLKGLPLLEWLDMMDPAGEWIIALPKRRALYRTPLEAVKKACEFHGEREVWHPMLDATDSQRDQWLARAGFTPLSHRSMECAPCVNSRAHEFASLSPHDQEKTRRLEMTLQQSFSVWGALDQLIYHQDRAAPPVASMDTFSMGCGDAFGCGL